MQYTKAVGSSHIKAFGQYFTKYEIADFMCSWACAGAKTVLDPAVGNSVFLAFAKKYSQDCILTGYEIDHKILSYFGNPTLAKIINKNYLLNDWDTKYDAIVCNPPYNRFQSVGNHDEIIEIIFKHTGIKYSGYTNLYILFLAKSIHQLSATGRLAYVVPSEFMNSKYGIAIKRLLIEKKLLRAIINFENDNEIFFNATTTCCILLLDYEEKKHVTFYSLKSIRNLNLDIINNENYPARQIDYCHLSASAKWRPYVNQEIPIHYSNLTPISTFCSISRGIATGSNDFFCFSSLQARENGIPKKCLARCICHSEDIKKPIFTETDFEFLSNSQKTVYLLDATSKDYTTLKKYIAYGQSKGIHQRYLPSHRNPWYSMEQKPPAPIWVTPNCRDGIKFIRNLAGTKSLTTFHSLFINDEYLEDINIIFCYFLTPIAQTIIRENRKTLGNGLEKFQPNDFNTAKMLDIRLLSTNDRHKITEIYCKMVSDYDDSYIRQLNEIFLPYLQ